MVRELEAQLQRIEMRVDLLFQEETAPTGTTDQRPEDFMEANSQIPCSDLLQEDVLFKFQRPFQSHRRLYPTQAIL